MQRYLVGDTITEADVRLFTTLARLDPVYHGHFKCNRSKLTEMPVLWAYARDLFQTPGFGDTVDFIQIKQHYYIVHADINPTRIVPKGPELANWLTTHGREALGGRPFGDGTPPGPPRSSFANGCRPVTGRPNRVSTRFARVGEEVVVVRIRTLHECSLAPVRLAGRARYREQAGQT